MPLFSMLRRPSYSAVSLAVRAVGSASTFHRAISTVLTFNHELIRRGSIPPRRFCTATATEQIGSESLPELLQSQIKRTEEKKITAPVVPDEFPFEIIDNPRENTILLKRQFEGESIQIGVDIPLIIQTDWDNYSRDEGDCCNDDPGIPMVVNITKENGLQLELGVTAFEEEILIDSLSVKQPEISPEKIAYDGPEFHDLDEILQNAWYKYVEVRGIKHNIACFLYDYMRKKERTEYLMWLKNVKGFIAQ